MADNVGVFTKLDQLSLRKNEDWRHRWFAETPQRGATSLRKGSDGMFSGRGRTDRTIRKTNIQERSWTLSFEMNPPERSLCPREEGGNGGGRSGKPV
jgi:hypothetical protein